MPQHKTVVEFVDKFGDKRVIHTGKKSSGTLALKRLVSTVPLHLNGFLGPMVGARIRNARESKGLSLSQLCRRAGIASASPKQRMYEIEKSLRKEGLRFGTLYAIAIALDVPIGDLLPTPKEVMDAAGVEIKANESLSL